MSGVYTAPRDADGLNLPTGSHHMDEPVLRRAGVAGGGGGRHRNLNQEALMLGKV